MVSPPDARARLRSRPLDARRVEAAALYAQQCVSTHLLRSHSAYSNTETSARSLTRLFDQLHGAEASISRDTLLHDTLPSFFCSWWHPSYGALLVEDAHA